MFDNAPAAERSNELGEMREESCAAPVERPVTQPFTPAWFRTAIKNHFANYSQAKEVKKDEGTQQG